MSTTAPRLSIKSILFICFCFLFWPTRNFSSFLSPTFFSRDESIIRFGDCFTPRFNRCSREFELNDLGDFISNGVLSINTSAVRTPDSRINSTLWPAAAKISATRISCGHGLLPAGITTLPLFIIRTISRPVQYCNPLRDGLSRLDFLAQKTTLGWKVDF